MLATILRRCGKRGVAVERVLAFAVAHVGSAMRASGVGSADRDAVESEVLEGVWRWWIPHARRVLADGSADPGRMEGALRSSMGRYARTRAAGRNRRASPKPVALTDDPTAPDGAPPSWVADDDEERFVNAVARGARMVLRKLCPADALAVLRMVLTVRRACGPRVFSAPSLRGSVRRGWSAARMAGEFARAIEESRP